MQARQTPRQSKGMPLLWQRGLYGTTSTKYLNKNVSRIFDHSHHIHPRLKPYYLDGYGSKSIGEPDWRPHPLNALSQTDAQQHSQMGGTGLDWYSSMRCPTRHQTIHQDARNDIKKGREAVKPKEPLSRRELLATMITQPKSDVDEDNRYYYMKPFELTLERAIGAKKKVRFSKAFEGFRIDHRHYGWISPTKQPIRARDFTGSSSCHMIIVSCKRNGITAASLGDKSYQVPEYSRDFHKHGSTRPVITFGGIPRIVPDTFIALQDLPLRPRPTFQARRKVFEKAKEIQEVVALDTWRPAPTLVASFQLPITACRLLH